MKEIVFLSLYIVIALDAAAQVSFNKQWDKRFGGTNDEGLYLVHQTIDGGYILGGYSYSGISGNKTQDNWDTTFSTSDFWVIKIDSIGNKQWDARFGGTSLDGLNLLLQTRDGGYIMGGLSYSSISGDRTQDSQGGDDYWIVKIDSLGNKQWDVRFGGTDDDLLESIIQCNDGGYLLGGASQSGAGGDKTQPSWGNYDYWIVKIDSAGNKQWDQDFGGTQEDGCSSLVQMSDGGFLLGGTSFSGSSGDKTNNLWGYSDYWIVKIDSAGNKVWDKDYGGANDNELSKLVSTSDGGVLLAGSSTSDSSGDKTSHDCYFDGGTYDYWMVKIDSGGNKLWDRDYGPGQLCSAFQTKNAGYILAGYSTAADAQCAKTENNLGGSQTWVVKTDSLGYKQWDKTIFTLGFDINGYAIETADGCYIAANSTLAGIGGYKTQPNWDATDSTSDYWMMKFCIELTTITEITNNLQLNIYPNPFADNLNINLTQQGLKQATFTITNTIGQTVYNKTENNLSDNYTKMLDLSYLPNGVYLVEITVNGEKICKEVVKE